MVWISSIKSHYALGNDLGIRDKFYGHEWEPAQLEVPDTPDDILASLRRSGQGEALARHEMPEASAVWDERRFSKVGQAFYSGGFFVVRKPLGDLLAQFDLGEGGLYPFDMYRADLKTPYPGEFFLLNFGAVKNSILPDSSRNVERFVVRKSTGQQIWKIHSWHEDGDVALSSTALLGSDLWIEAAVDNKIFISDRLADALIEAGLKDVFDLKRCRVIEGTA